MTSRIIYEGDLRTVCRHERSGTEIQTDAPVDNKGKGERFSPSDLLATSLGACMITIMGIKAREMDIDLKGIEIGVEKIMKQEPRRVGGINLTFHIPAHLEISEKQQKILENAAHTCPVINSIHPDIEVKTDFLWDQKVGVKA